MHTSTSRKLYLDNLKGFLIFLVFLGHFIVPFTNDPSMLFLRKWIYVFHMPAFLMVSGCLQRKKVLETSGNQGFRFAISFLLQNTLLYLCMLLTETGTEYSLSGGIYNPTMGLWAFWYLQALFFYSIITGRARKAVPLFLFALGLYFFVPFFPAIASFNFTKIASFYIFYLIGFYGLTEDNLDLLRRIPLRILSLLVLASVFMLLYLFRDCFSMTDLTLMQQYQTYPSLATGIFYRLSYLVIAVIISVCLISVMPSFAGLTARMGRNSVYIYALHNYLLSIFYYVNRHWPFFPYINTPLTYGLFVLGSYVVCLLMVIPPVIRKTKWLVEPYRYLNLDPEINWLWPIHPKR